MIYLTLISLNPLCDCLDGQVVPLFLVNEIAGRVYYRGTWDMTCVFDNNEPDIIRTYTFETDCAAGGSTPFGTITIRYVHSPNGQGLGPGGPFLYYAVPNESEICDPLYIRYEEDGGGGNVAWVRCDGSTQDPVDVEMELTS